MALTYRSPIEEVLTYLEPAAQSLIASTATTSYQQSERENFEWFNYSLPAIAKEHLSQAGIYLSPYSGYPHSHPVCKTLENYLLYKVLPGVINNSFYFVGIKQFKLNFLKKRHKNLEMLKAINRYVSSADKIRYGNEFVVRMSTELRTLRRHTLAECDTLRDLTPNIPEYSNLFLHDELHYWSKEQLVTFLEICKPQVMLGTVVYPTEIFVGAEQSLNPWCYEFEVKCDRLLYYPDGVRAEGYDQPLSGGYLLKANKIKLLDGTVYCVDVICSKFSHHLVSLTRGDLVVPSYRSFGPFEAVSSRSLKDITWGAGEYFPVAHQTILRVYRYLRSLKKPDKQSAMAKFSQLNHEPSGQAIKFMEELSSLIIDTEGIRTMIKPEVLKCFYGNLGRKLPAALASKIKDVRGVCLDDFISTLKPLTVDLKLVTVSASTPVELCPFSARTTQVEGDVDLVELVGAAWEGARPYERTPSPYVGMAPLSDKHKRWSVLADSTLASQIVYDLYVGCCFHEDTGFSMGVMEYVARLKSGTRVSLAPLLFAMSLEQTQAVEIRARNLNIPRVHWHDHRVFWFICKASARANLVALEEPRAYYAAEQAEFMSTHIPRKACRFVMQTYCTEEELYGRFSVEDHKQGANTREEEPASKGVEPEVLRATTGRMVNCSCGNHVEVARLLHTEDREVECADRLHGRRACWFSKNNAPYIYAGGTCKSRGWPRWLELWMVLNSIDGKYDCMLAQEYEQGGVIPFNDDDEAMFAEGESILTVNLDGSAEFGVSCTMGESWFPIQHGDVFEVPAEFQRSHKYSVRGDTARRKMFKFRVLKGAHTREQMSMVNTINEGKGPSEGAEEESSKFSTEQDGVHISCHKVEGPRKFKVIKNAGGGDCFWLALSHYTGVTVSEMKKSLRLECAEHNIALKRQLGEKVWTEDEGIVAACKKFGLNFQIYDERQESDLTFSYPGNKRVAMLKCNGSHFEAIMPLEGCTVQALADCVQRKSAEVFSVLVHALGAEFVDRVMAGRGVDVAEFVEMCKALDVHAVVELEDETVRANEGGRVFGHFALKEGHATLIRGKSVAVHKQTNVLVEEVRVSAADMLPISTVSTKLAYEPSAARAKILSDSLLQGSTGVLCSELYNNQSQLFPEEPNLGKRIIHVVLGTFGCGKSRVVKRVMQMARTKAVIYISPRKFLCDDFQSAIEELKKKFGEGAGRNFKSLTFEKALLQAGRVAPGALVVLDEVQLFPPGFLSLLCCLLPIDLEVAVFGDPCQSDYDSEKDRAILGALDSDIVDLLADREYGYNVLSHRFIDGMFRGRLPCKFSSDASIDLPLRIIEGLESVDTGAAYSKVCLVSSFEEKKIVQAYFGSKCKTLTFGESTGATFTEGSVLVTHISVHTSERRWLTALSRFRKGLTIVNASGSPTELLSKVYEGRALGRFLNKQADVEQLRTVLPGKPVFTDGFAEVVFGADEGKREAKLQGDPWLKTMIDLLQVEDAEVIEEAKVILQDEWCRTHLPQCELEGVRARWVHKILAKEFREKRMGYLVSEQFTDEHSRQLGKQLTNAAERFEAIYPRHRASDTVTFIMAVRKRLRFSNPVKESAKLNQAMPYGPFLLKEFLKHVPIKPAHNTVFMAEAKFDFEEKKTSKSAATIENHSNRSMREWAVDIGLVFSKSQLCTKFDNRFRDAKAAQTIVCFQHAVLCRFAPYMRYIEKKLNEVLPEKYYIHSGKGLEELNEWVIRGGFDRLCTESDYEAFDASQDQYIVAFEVCLMKYLGLPTSLIEDYKFIKTHLGSKLGSFAIMRFSGEASTFLFNTMANMLFTFLQYDIKGDERICFAGDDMCSNKRLHVKETHKSFLKKLKLKAKVAHTTTPTFCGWNLCPDGIFKKPQLVLERLCIAKETNNLVNCIDNYAIEVAFAYRMGERAKERMTEEEVEAFYNCVRIIVKNKHLLKSEVLLTYQTEKVM